MWKKGKFRREISDHSSGNTDLRRAILAVQSGMQIRAAARTFGVDHTRIIRQIKINPNVSAKCDQIEAWPKFKEEVDRRTAKH